MKQINTAIIGSGFMGAAHLEALRRVPGINIVAIASDDELRARELAEAFGIVNVLIDWKDLLALPDLNAVHNCTPNNLHFEINKAFLENNIHVVSEKPLTLNSRDSKKLVSLAEKKKLVTAINFNYRFYPLIQHAHQMMKSGELGDLYITHGHYLQDWLYYDTDYNWRLETEISGESRAIADIGSHWCDLIQFVSGQKIKRVFADLTTIHKIRKKPAGEIETFKGKEVEAASTGMDTVIKTEDIGIVIIELSDGSKGTFTVSQVSAGRKNHFSFEMDCSKKAIYWNQEEPNQLWIGYREKANEILIKDPSLLAEKARSFAHYPGGHPEGYPDGPKNMFMRFYDFIRKGKNPLKDAPEFPTFRDGWIENKIVDAILKSNKEQKWVSV
jgi:predicted dehydrogenase